MRPAARRAALVTLVYLLVTSPLLLRGEPSTQYAVVVLFHLAATACVWWSLRARTANPIADWLPLLLVPFLYAELPYLMGPNVAFRDLLVQRWEIAIFGTQPARTLAGALPNAALSELLHLGYLLYYPIVYVPPMLLYVAKRYDDYDRTVLALMATYALCFLVFILFPVEGPRYVWGAPPDAPRGPVRWIARAILERGSSRGTAFPSSHAAVSAAQAVAALRYQGWSGAAVSAASVFLMVGAIYGGFHYAVDVLAGAVVGIVIALVVLTRPART